MEEKSIETKEGGKTEEKKAYAPPMLTVYGKLTELTAGSNGTSIENTPYTKLPKT